MSKLKKIKIKKSAILGHSVNDKTHKITRRPQHSASADSDLFGIGRYVFICFLSVKCFDMFGNLSSVTVFQEMVHKSLFCSGSSTSAVRRLILASVQ